MERAASHPAFPETNYTKQKMKPQQLFFTDKYIFALMPDGRLFQGFIQNVFGSLDDISRPVWHEVKLPNE
jgi:hypothetical protein